MGGDERGCMGGCMRLWEVYVPQGDTMRQMGVCEMSDGGVRDIRWVVCGPDPNHYAD